MPTHTYTLDAALETETGVDIGIGGTARYVTGEDVTIEFTVYETTDHSTAVDIGSANEIEWVLTDGDGAESVTKSQTGGGVTLTADGSDGKFDVDLNASDTSGLATGTVEHQATLTDSAGDVSVVAQGDFQLSENYT